MARNSSKKKPTTKEVDEPAPEMEPSSDDSSASDEDGSASEEEEYDSAAEEEEENEPQVSDQYDDSSNGESDEFEEQGSSDDEDDLMERQKSLNNDNDESDDEDVEILDLENLDAPRSWPKIAGSKKKRDGKQVDGNKELSADSSKDATNAPAPSNDAATAQWMHTDNLSSDDEDDDGTQNRIGRVPLHWYDDYSHIGYDAHGSQVIKSTSATSNKDLLDQVLDADNAQADSKNGKFTVYDELNAKDVQLSQRQIELIRRLQSGAFAHPEHESNPEYIDYFSGVNKLQSGLNSNKYEKKSRFQPSVYEKLQVKRLLHRLKCGSINMDYLDGKVRDMNDLIKKDGEDNIDGKPFQLWKGNEEDELALRKGPQHMAAPKVPPPGHAYSYNPPEEYLPNEDEIQQWNELDVQDRPYGNFIPKKYTNLRSVGAYEHSVKDTFERCLDLYLCPRAMKRRLNIDPESLVPQLPKASDLRPFPTSKCLQYVVPGNNENSSEEESEEAVVVRCLSISSDGQFLASGDENGVVRLWEVQTGRLLKSWNLNDSVVKLIGNEKKDDDGEGEDEKVSLTCAAIDILFKHLPSCTNFFLPSTN